MPEKELFAVLGVVVLCVLLVALYFLPSMVAAIRSHNNFASIFVINLFLGATVVGWIVALAMSVSADTKKQDLRNKE